jgi:hypothetical protein
MVLHRLIRSRFDWQHHRSQCPEYQHADCNKLHQRTRGCRPAVVPCHLGRAGPQFLQRSGQRLRSVHISPIRGLRSSGCTSLLWEYCPSMAMVLYSWSHCKCSGSDTILLLLPPANIRKSSNILFPYLCQRLTPFRKCCTLVESPS